MIERAVLLSTGAEIGLADLPDSIGGGDRAEQAIRGGVLAGLRATERWREQPLRRVREEVVAAVEHRYLSDLLAETRGRIGEAARRAGLNPRSLYNLMRRHGLRKEAFKISQVEKQK